MGATVAPAARSVVGRGGEPQLIRRSRSAARLLLEEENQLAAADEDAAAARRYLGAVTFRLPVVSAVVLTVAQ